MPSKLGCGPVIAFALILLILLMVGSNQAIGYYFSHCHDMDVLECMMRGLGEPEPEPEGAVAATGTYEYKGYAVTVTMNIPLEGGNVTGTVSGTCDGTVKASFDGQSNGTISGSLHGACSPFFINIPASADFSGTVKKTAKSVPIGFTGRGGGLTHEGSMTLSW